MVRITSKQFEMLRRRRQTGNGRQPRIRSPRSIINPAEFHDWLTSMGAQPGVFIAIKTSTPGNNRRHWSKESKDARQQRSNAALALLSVRDTLPSLPVRVRLTRHGPRTCDEHNLPGAMKHIIDGVADFYRVDDSDSRLKFSCHQTKSKFYGVRIEITELRDESASQKG